MYSEGSSTPQNIPSPSNGHAFPVPITGLGFSQSPRRLSVSFGSVGRPGFFGSAGRPKFLEPLNSQERSQLLQDEEALLADNAISIGQAESQPCDDSTARTDNLIPVTTDSTHNSTLNYQTIGQDDINEAWRKAVIQKQLHTTAYRELKVLTHNSIPLCLTFLLQYSLTVVSIFCVGHLGKNELAAVSLATMTCNIFGYAIFQGIATSLGTVAAQAYGRGDYRMVGVNLQRCLVLMCIPGLVIGLFWFFSKPILYKFIPEHDLCDLAVSYLRILSFGIPGYVVFECMKHYLQAQGIFHASTYVLFISAPVNLVLNYVLVWNETLELGFIGAPIAVATTDSLMAVLLVLYTCFIDGSQCWDGFTWQALSNWHRLVHLSVPGVLMIEGEWLAFEVLTFAAAKFGTTALATQTVLATLCVLVYQIPMSIGIAASARVANLVGATLDRAAALSANVSLVVSVVFGIFNATVLFSFRDKVGALFSSDPDVILMVSQLLPYGAIYQVNDCLGAVSSGVLRGQGRQYIGGYLNLFFYYVVALPIAFYLAFNLNWQLAGLWMGIVIALFFVSILQVYFILTSDWHRIMREAKEDVSTP